MSNKGTDIQFDRNTGFLFKGPPGFSKTIAAVSAAIYGPVYLAYIDKKAPVEVMLFFKKHRPEVLENLTWDSYGSNNIHEYLNKLISFTQSCPYVAVITDSVTSLTSAAVNWSLSFRDSSGGGKRDKKNKDAPAMIPDWDEYKVETSLLTQALDICKMLPVMNIWTAHPLPILKISGSGASQVITQTQSIVSYGNKVGALIPGAFQEIYHFGKQVDKRVVFTDMVGDDYAKTCLPLPKVFDITDKLFFEVWRDLVNAGFQREDQNEATTVNTEGKGSTKWRV